MTTNERKLRFITFIALIVLLVSTILPHGLFSFNVKADENEARTDGVQRINANDLKWTPVSKDNPLGGADDFNALLFNEFKNFHETGAGVAARIIKDVNIITFREGPPLGINRYMDYSIPKYNVGVITKEHLGQETQVANGDVVISNEDIGNFSTAAGQVFSENNSEVESFFEQAYNDLSILQKTLFELEVNGEITPGVYSDFESSESIKVFEIDNSFSGDINFVGNSNDTFIIKLKKANLNGTNFWYNGTQMNTTNIEQIVNRVIWVLDPAITEFNGGSSHIIGSFLAPDANITFTGNGSIDGTTIANTIDGGGTSTELHYTGLFKGNLFSNDTGNPTEKEKVTPLDPIIKQGTCEVNPSVQTEDTDEVTYVVSGDQVPGGTVTVTASANEGYKFEDTPGWKVSEDGKTATKEITLDKTDCDQAVDLVDPTVTQGTCEIEPSVETEDTEGVTYTITGDQVPGGTVTVRASAKEGYKFEDTSGWKVSEDGKTATKEITLDKTDCDQAVDLVDPTVTQGTCEIEPSVETEDTEGVTYTITGDQVPGGTVTVRASAKEGYKFEGTSGWKVSEDGKTATKEITLDKTDCDQAVDLVDPTVTQGTCEIDPTVETKDTEKITYTISDNQVPGGTVTVTASANEGYKFEDTQGWEISADGKTATKEITLDDIVKCEEEPETVKPESPIVEQGYCDENGGLVNPNVKPKENKGITYEVEGDVIPGGKVTITAAPKEGYELDETDGWTLNEDGTATQEITLAEVDCEKNVPKVCKVDDKVINIDKGNSAHGTVQKENIDIHVNYVLNERLENGQVLIDGKTGDWTYVVHPDFVGTDTFTIYTYDENGNVLCEETITIIVKDKDTTPSTPSTPTDKDNSDQDKGSSGNELPKTATNVFNTLLIGFIALAFGATVFFARREGNEQA